VDQKKFQKFTSVWIEFAKRQDFRTNEYAWISFS